jgi:predicted lipoprotein with Yx(FWY)xxD motif
VRRMTYMLALMAVAAIVVAGCGDGSDSSSSGGAYGGKGGGGYGGGGSTASSEEKPASDEGESGDGIVSAAKVGELGTILVTSEGMTLYDFHKDKGGESSCYGACAGAWPPLLTEGDPQAQGAADRGLLGTTKRKDGTVQVTYNGWPLYTYVGDQEPGEANGNDIDQFGAEWYALQPNGEEPED